MLFSNMPYPDMGIVLVLAVQERSISEVDTGSAERFWGTEGGMLWTVIVVWAVLVPFPLDEAVRVYVVVEVGATFQEPMRVEVENPPGVILTEEALLTFQESVEVTLGSVYWGEEEKELIKGAFPEGVTLPEGEEEAPVPARLVAVTTKV